MGGNISVSNKVSETLNKTTNDFIFNNTSVCSVSQSGNQEINIQGIEIKGRCSADFSGISNNSIAQSEVRCSVENRDDVDLQAEFKAKVEQDTKNAVSGLSIGLNVNVSNSISKFANTVSNSVNIKNTAQSISQQVNNQIINIKDNKSLSCPACCDDPALSLDSRCNCTIKFNNLANQLLQNAVVELIAKNNNLADAISTLDAEIKQATSNTIVGLSVTDFVLLIGGGLLLLLFLIFVLPRLLGGSSNSAPLILSGMMPQNLLPPSPSAYSVSTASSDASASSDSTALSDQSA